MEDLLFSEEERREDGGHGEGVAGRDWEERKDGGETVIGP